MSELVILGYIAAVLMGGVLGLIGAGGSILTVPILVYLMAVPPAIATAYSLLIVGTTAAFGAFRYLKNGLINVSETLLFAVPSIVAVYLSRAFIMPAIPEVILSQPVELSKNNLLMVVFALLMMLSALMMLRGSKANNETQRTTQGSLSNKALIIVEGSVVGLITGILGAGGGFLIVPALVLLMNMPMKRAVGASLLIIAAKSLIGFVGDIQTGIELQMPLLPLMLLATFLGMMLSSRLLGRLNDATLKKGFSIFVLTIGALILVKELVI